MQGFFRTEVEEEIREVLALEGGTPHGLASLYWYHMGFSDRDGNISEWSKGKYLRPTVCLAMCAALNGDPSQALPAAASIELIHRTSLIFDDIQDRGMERNRRPTVWTVWGQNQAINAGLALSCLARLALHRMTVPAGLLLRIQTVLEKAVMNLCRGQYRDIFLGETVDATVGDYMEMVRGKTGTLFGASCEVGAMCANAKPDEIAQARELGLLLGTSFQVHDDFLGIWGDERVGKTANDLQERKRSLPVVLALEEDRQFMGRWLKQDTIPQQEVDAIRDWMERQGIPDKVRVWEDKLTTAAQHILNSGLPLLPDWRKELLALTSFAVERKA